MKIFLSRKKCVFGSSFRGQISLLAFATKHAACVIKDGILKSNSLNLDRNLNQQQNMFCIFLRAGGENENQYQFWATSL